MIILPAIDLLDGQVVRLREGKLEDKTVYSDDPLAFARRWEEEGGNCLHVVDLNAAFTGEPRNIEMIKRLVRTLNIPVQVGGGIRSQEAATTFIKAGVSRVVIGTGAVDSPIFLENLVNRFGENSRQHTVPGYFERGRRKPRPHKTARLNAAPLRHDHWESPLRRHYRPGRSRGLGKLPQRRSRRGLGQHFVRVASPLVGTVFKIATA